MLSNKFCSKFYYLVYVCVYIHTYVRTYTYPHTRIIKLLQGVTIEKGTTLFRIYGSTIGIIKSRMTHKDKESYVI